MHKRVAYGHHYNRTAEEAQRLGVSTEKLITLVKEGVVPAIRLGSRSWIVDPIAVDEVLKKIPTNHQAATN